MGGGGVPTTFSSAPRSSSELSALGLVIAVRRALAERPPGASNLLLVLAAVRGLSEALAHVALTDLGARGIWSATAFGKARFECASGERRTLVTIAPIFEAALPQIMGAILAHRCAGIRRERRAAALVAGDLCRVGERLAIRSGATTL